MGARWHWADTYRPVPERVVAAITRAFQAGGGSGGQTEPSMGDALERAALAWVGADAGARAAEVLLAGARAGRVSMPGGRADLELATEAARSARGRERAARRGLHGMVLQIAGRSTPATPIGARAILRQVALALAFGITDGWSRLVQDDLGLLALLLVRCAVLVFFVLGMLRIGASIGASVGAGVAQAPAPASDRSPEEVQGGDAGDAAAERAAPAGDAACVPGDRWRAHARALRHAPWPTPEGDSTRAAYVRGWEAGASGWSAGSEAPSAIRDLAAYLIGHLRGADARATAAAMAARTHALEVVGDVGVAVEMEVVSLRAWTAGATGRSIDAGWPEDLPGDPPPGVERARRLGFAAGERARQDAITAPLRLADLDASGVHDRPESIP